MKIKKNALLLAVSAIFFVSLILSCSKKTDSVSGEDLVPAEEEKFSLVVAKEKKTLRSLALYRDKEGNGAPLYVENKDADNVTWASEITGGTVLKKASDDVVNKNIVTKEKTWKDIPFYAVSYEGNNYFIQTRDSVSIENKKEAAVVVHDAVLFTKPHPASFRNAWVEAGTVTAASYDNGRKIVKVTFFDSASGFRRTRYVMAENISWEEKDIRAVQLLAKASSIKETDLQKEFLDNAVEAADSEELESYILKRRNKILGISSFGEDEIEDIDLFYANIYTDDDSKVNLRFSPGTAGEKAGLIESGIPVSCVRATTSQDTIDGVSAKWYYVTAYKHGDFEGWIFGGFLTLDGAGPEELEALDSERGL